MPRPKSENPLTPAQNTARYREKKLSTGRQIPTIILSPEDSAKLAMLEATRGAGPTEVVRQLIREAR